MKTKQIAKVCIAGHGFRCHPTQMRCDCGRELVEKQSAKGQEMLSARTAGTKKMCSAGNALAKTGKRQGHRTFGECETAISMR